MFCAKIFFITINLLRDLTVKKRWKSRARCAVNDSNISPSKSIELVESRFHSCLPRVWGKRVLSFSEFQTTLKVPALPSQFASLALPVLLVFVRLLGVLFVSRVPHSIHLRSVLADRRKREWPRRRAHDPHHGGRARWIVSQFQWSTWWNWAHTFAIYWCFKQIIVWLLF